MRKFLLRLLLILPAIFLQGFLYVALFKWLSAYSSIISIITTILSSAMVLFILDKRMEGSYKTFWLVIIFVFPVAGTWIYFICGYFNAAKSLERKSSKTECLNIPKTEDVIFEEISEKDKRAFQSFNYLSNATGFPIVKTKNVKYYSIVDKAFPEMLEALNKAKKYIFLEFFIIENGKMLDSIVDVLKEKVKQGVKVYILYDDLGSIFTYSFKEVKKLKNDGIFCMPFNPLITIRPILNNRDHRKIMVIDNEIVFTGGFNLADEYINEKVKYGHWKDIAVKMEGAIVNSYSKMFVDLWNTVSKEKINLDMISLATSNNGNGYSIAYFDSPARDHSVSNTLIIDLLSQVTERAWFYTPYLILNDSLQEALVQCARRGVDVRMITPGIPDKKIVYAITKSNYDHLLINGVKIFEYSPGFIHAKACVFDNNIATIGTVNLDYRSLFLHYECNCLFYQSTIVKEIENDFNDTLKKCKEVVKKNKIHFSQKIVRSILKLISPLC